MAGRNTGAIPRNSLPSPFVRYPLRTLTEEMVDRVSTAGGIPSAMSTLNSDALSRSMGENSAIGYGSDRSRNIRSEAGREFALHRPTIEEIDEDDDLNGTNEDYDILEQIRQIQIEDRNVQAEIEALNRRSQSKQSLNSDDNNLGFKTKLSEGKAVSSEHSFKQINKSHEQSRQSYATDTDFIKKIAEESISGKIESAISVAVRECNDRTLSMFHEGMSKMFVTMDTKIKEINKKISDLEKPSVEQTYVTTSQNNNTSTSKHNIPNTVTPQTINQSTHARQSRNSQNLRDNFRRVNVQKWEVKFDGSPKSIPVESFIFRVESQQRKYNLSDEDLLADFHYLLSGAAATWYWQYLEENDSDSMLLSYQDLKSELRNQFKNKRKDPEILRLIMDRKQLAHETFDEFYSDVRALFLQMSNRLTDQDKLGIVRPNIKDKVANLIFSSSINSIRELREECRRAEIHLEAREVRFRKNVSEIEHRKQQEEDEWKREDSFDNEGDDEYELAAMQQNRQNSNFNKKSLGPNRNFEKDKRPSGNIDLKDVENNKTTCPSGFHTMTCYCCGQGNISFKCASCMGKVQVGSSSGSQLPTKTQPPAN